MARAQSLEGHQIEHVEVKKNYGRTRKQIGSFPQGLTRTRIVVVARLLHIQIQFKYINVILTKIRLQGRQERIKVQKNSDLIPLRFSRKFLTAMTKY